VDAYGIDKNNKGEKYMYAFLVEVFEEMAMESGMSNKREVSKKSPNVKGKKEGK
jgi:hypothetical protein